MFSLADKIFASMINNNGTVKMVMKELRFEITNSGDFDLTDEIAKTVIDFDIQLNCN